MGKVIGPLTWKPKDRLASWFMLRQLREDIKWMNSENPQKYSLAIAKEKQTVKEEFDRYVNAA